MSRPPSRSTLYRLIEAGQRAHQSLLAPLRDRGLEPGDDAVLFVLSTRGGASADEIVAETGLDPAVVASSIDRLIAQDLVQRRAVGPLLQPGLALTERGSRVHAILEGNWTELENALLGELDAKDRKRLSRTLKRFVDLLRL